MSDVDEVKSRLNIVEIVGEHVRLKKAGRHFKGLCPFHSEKTPSFIVSPDRQIFKCFGCGKGGSVIDFVMEYEHIDFLDALSELAQKAGVQLSRHAFDTPQAKLKQKIYEANHLASEFYHYLLVSHPLGAKAREYLKTREISDKSVKTFTLGYSPNSWDGLLKYLLKKGYDLELLIQAGLVVQSNKGGYDRFRGRLMFTLRDARGNVVGFSGRLLDPNASEAKYINTSDTPVYSKSDVLYGLDVTKAAIQKAGEALIMEGEIDVISSFQAGVSNVVAIKGSALTEGHVRLLKRYSERLIFALDSDLAGDSASRRGIDLAEKAGFDMRVVILPNGKDPDEAARTSPGLFKKAVAEAIPIYDYFLSSALKRFDVGTAFGKKKISDEMLPIIAQIDNPIVQNHYIKRLAETMGVGETSITEGLKKVASRIIKRSVQPEPESTGKAILTRLDRLEQYLLALLIQGDTASLVNELSGQVSIEDFQTPAIGRIIILLREYLGKKGGKDFSSQEFALTLPRELVPTLDDAFLWDLSPFEDKPEKLVQEWNMVLATLHKMILKRKINALTNLPVDQAGGADDKTLKKYSSDLTQLEKATTV